MFQIFQGRGSRMLIIMNYSANYCQITHVQKKRVNFVNGFQDMSMIIVIYLL